MSSNLKVEANRESLIYQIIMKLVFFGVNLEPEEIKRIYEMSDDELANVAVDVGLEIRGDTNRLTSMLGSLGVPTRSDNLFLLLLEPTTSSSIDSLQGLLDQFSRLNSPSASTLSS